MPSEVFSEANVQRPDLFTTKNQMVGNGQFNKHQPASADEYEQSFGHSETNSQLAWSSQLPISQATRQFGTLP
jgi:hypothetical protein